MKLDEIMKLIDAGYTKADIDALTSADDSADDSAEQEQHADQQAQQDQQSSDQPAAQAQQQPAADPILEALNKLTDTIIKSNINHTVTQPAQRTPEQALAEIIAPPKPKQKER